MAEYDETPCSVSQLPKYSCYDCKHHLHGKPIPESELTMGNEVVGPASYVEHDSRSVSDLVRYANVEGVCDYPGCEKRIKASDPILRDEDYGWVHARHAHGG